ncbi:MAG: zinc ABC transporter substrate-binding protein [Nitrosopumilaceae archaeon]|nr:zinc ABC transporter substrate-binding protein [Nitrosopumilaceae archaeon]
MVSRAVYAGIAIAVIIPLAIFVVYSTTIEPEPADVQDVTPVEEPKIFVLSSFYPIEQFVSNVGGDRIESALVLPPGAEPHDWEPTVKDVQNMKSADVVVINGIGFETWVESLGDIGFEGVLIDTSKGIEVMEAVEGAHGHEDEDEDHGMEAKEDDDDDDHGMEAKEDDEDEDHHEDELLGDPHIWLNPVLVQIQVQNIADGLSEADPKNADYYQENADRYIAELQQLDSDIRAGLESCSREFVAFHQAFTYFTLEYGLVQHTILKSATPHSEVAPRTLQAVIETAKAQGIDVIFTEEAVDPRTAQVVADEIGGSVMVLSPLEIGEPGETYVSKMYNNLENLQVALCHDQ